MNFYKLISNKLLLNIYTRATFEDDYAGVFKSLLVQNRTQPQLSILCSDYSFWRNKKCYNDSNYFDQEIGELYTETRRCSSYTNVTQNDTQLSGKLKWIGAGLMDEDDLNFLNDFLVNVTVKGNSYCNDEKNNVGCDWDGGDCCGPNVRTFFCSQCVCLDPNSQDRYECKRPDSYFCPLSKICIPNEWKCDGAVQCIHGDDEDFELCKDSFPEAATITCLEKDRPFYEIWIKATPCDGVVECKDGQDENCQLDPPGMDYIIMTSIVFVIFSAWIYKYIQIHATRANSDCTILIHSFDEPAVIADDPEVITSIDWDPDECKKYKGMKLIDLKV